MNDIIDFLERHWGMFVCAVGKKRAAKLVAMLKDKPGFVCVPVEPTEDMKALGALTPVMHSWGKDGEFITDESAADIYRAMLSPYTDSTRQQEDTDNG